MLTTTLTRVIFYIFALLAAYGAGIGFVFLFVKGPDLIDMVSACKIVSLLILIYANREIPHNIDMTRQSDVQNLNMIIISMSMVVLILLVIKTIVQDYALISLPDGGAAILRFFFYNSYWISTLPIFAYCALDMFIAFFRDSPSDDRRIAVEFVIFRDLVCAVPLALVLLLTELYLYLSPRLEADAHAEFFFSGAIAVILLSSAISSRALDLLQTKRRQRTGRQRSSGLILDTAEQA